eukprot:2808088-Pyramimonas_sp.AAC.1
MRNSEKSAQVDTNRSQAVDAESAALVAATSAESPDDEQGMCVCVLAAVFEDQMFSTSSAAPPYTRT